MPTQPNHLHISAMSFEEVCALQGHPSALPRTRLRIGEDEVAK